ncbi:hypothetical protein Actkin_01009 [Actinokineospora sp. UTMC 2448]|nr:hypothetical protein Actkin_01009 [Actinokineospora sp. UTMC 2448]
MLTRLLVVLLVVGSLMVAAPRAAGAVPRPLLSSVSAAY